MSREVWEMVRNNDANEIEWQMALHCAPLITGIKVSNLLSVAFEEFYQMQRLVKNSHISWYLLGVTERKVTVLLYHQKSLESYIQRPKVKEKLHEMGYKKLNLKDILQELGGRYQQYLNHKKDFPHEMGLLLGYPVEDVEGFMKHKGRDFLCTGYWKVYEDQAGKLKIFNDFELAKERLIRLLSHGVSMGDIIHICCSRMENRIAEINY